MEGVPIGILHRNKMRNAIFYRKHNIRNLFTWYELIIKFETNFQKLYI
jgi:hypothetical protein